MDFNLLQFGLLGTLCIALLSGLIGIISANDFTQKLSYSLLALVGMLGVGTGIATLFSHATVEVGVIGVTLRLDSLAAFFFTLISGVVILVSMYAPAYLAHYRTTYHAQTVTFLTAIFIIGMFGVTTAVTPVTFLVAWELMSISSFFLVFSDREEASIHAALIYLVMTTLGAGAILLAFMLIAQGGFFTDFSELSALVTALPANVLLAAAALFFFGFGSKAGLVPAHTWLPQAHPQAPSHISALMSGVMLKIAVYGFIRVALILVPVLPGWVGYVVLGFGLLSAFFGALSATVEQDFKRLLAFSSIENLGIIFVMLGLAMIIPNGFSLSSWPLLIALFFAANHAIFKSGLFLIAGNLAAATHTRSLDQLGGLAARMPWTSGAFLILILAAGALPPTGTFVAEWFFIQQILELLPTATPFLQFALVTTLVISALVAGLAIFAMVRLFAFAALAEPRSEHARRAKELSLGLTLPVWLLALCSIGFGAGSTFFLGEQFLDFTIVTDGGAVIAPAALTGLFAFIFLLVFAARKIFSDAGKERLYHTWDCGQPIDATMEYTATAFAAPLRFFFNLFLRTEKRVLVELADARNPWFARRTCKITLHSIFADYFYEPIVSAINWISGLVSRIQNGVVQFYLALIFIALITSLFFAL